MYRPGSMISTRNIAQVGIYGLAIVISCTTALTSAAQGGVRNSTSDSARAEAAVPRASNIDPYRALPSDTGRTVRPDSMFTRYDAPSQCYAAAVGLKRSVQRSDASDTLPLTIAIRNPVLPAIVITAARRCLVRFAVSTIGTIHLYDLMALALLAREDSIARDVVSRRMTLAKTVLERADVLDQSIWLYLYKDYVHEDAAIELLKQLDALGVPARLSRITAHGAMLEYGREIFDSTIIRREAELLRPLVRSLTQVERDSLGPRAPDAITPLLYLAMVNGAQSLHAEVTRLKSEIPQMTLQMASSRIAMMGKQAPLLEAEFWYPIDTAHNPIQLGRTSLMYFVHQSSTIQPAPARNAMLRRLYRTYGDSGLAITLLTNTVGYTRWSASPPQTPEQEAKAARWYYMEHLGLPVSLAVEATKFHALPDGRRENALTQFWERYAGAPVMIVDRAGAVRCISLDMRPLDEPVISVCVKKALGGE